MDNKEYTAAVERKEYPKERICPLGSRFVDNRGLIQNLIESAAVNSVAIIFSKAGTERSNHQHRTADHYLYVVSGKMEYFERLPEEDASKITPLMVSEGEMVYTPPGVVHLTRFLADTMLISIGSNPRSHIDHEGDLIRIPFFGEKNEKV